MPVMVPRQLVVPREMSCFFLHPHYLLLEQPVNLTFPLHQPYFILKQPVRMPYYLHPNYYFLEQSGNPPSFPLQVDITFETFIYLHL